MVIEPDTGTWIGNLGGAWFFVFVFIFKALEVILEGWDVALSW